MRENVGQYCHAKFKMEFMYSIVDAEYVKEYVRWKYRGVVSTDSTEEESSKR